MARNPSLSLRDGTKIPLFGLGTWKSAPGEVYHAVRTALELGYRHLDCAAIYENEAEVGRAIEDAIKAGDVTREKLWVTSKLWNDAHLPEHVPQALQKTLTDLRLDYLDLYLIHWPVAFRHGITFAREREEFLPLQEAPLEKTWEAMVGLKEDGKTRQVGVSNMGPVRIDALSSAVEPPAVNQVECHPHLQQRELLQHCQSRGIHITAYSPLGSTDRARRKEDEPPLLDHPVITTLAEELNASPAQVLIAWAIARDTSVIPKSVNPGRIAENLAALEVDLQPRHMSAIEDLDKGYRYIDGTFFAGENSPYKAHEIWI